MPDARREHQRIPLWDRWGGHYVENAGRELVLPIRLGYRYPGLSTSGSVSQSKTALAFDNAGEADYSHDARWLKWPILVLQDEDHQLGTL